MAEMLQPLLSPGWANFFMWIFIIVAVGMIFWYTLYLSNSKDKTPRTTMWGLFFTSLFSALALMMVFVRYNIAL